MFKFLRKTQTSYLVIYSISLNCFGSNFEIYTCIKNTYIMQKHLILSTLLFSIFFSCTTVKITSNKSSYHNQKLDNVFVLLQSEAKASKFTKNCANKLMLAFKKHNIKGRYTQKNNLSLTTDKEYLQRINAFAPNQIMIFKQTAINFRAPNIINTIVFDIKIIDQKTSKTIWKSELNIYEQVGLENAVDKRLKKMIQQLKKDQLIKTHFNN